MWLIQGHYGERYANVAGECDRRSEESSGWDVWFTGRSLDRSLFDSSIAVVCISRS